MPFSIWLAALAVVGGVALAWWSSPATAPRPQVGAVRAQPTAGFARVTDMREATLQQSAPDTRGASRLAQRSLARLDVSRRSGSLTASTVDCAASGMSDRWTIEQVLAAKLLGALVGLFLGGMFFLGAPSSGRLVFLVFVTASSPSFRTSCSPDTPTAAGRKSSGPSPTPSTRSRLRRSRALVRGGPGRVAQSEGALSERNSAGCSRTSRSGSPVARAMENAARAHGRRPTCGASSMRSAMPSAMAFRSRRCCACTAAELRDKRQQRAEERAMKIPREDRVPGRAVHPARPVRRARRALPSCGCPEHLLRSEMTTETPLVSSDTPACDRQHAARRRRRHVARGALDRAATFPTEFTPLDDVLGGGFRAQELVLLGGRPGVGKTIAALQWARSFAMQGRTALYVCYEHSPQVLLGRLFGLELGSLVRADEVIIARPASLHWRKKSHSARVGSAIWLPIRSARKRSDGVPRRTATGFVSCRPPARRLASRRSRRWSASTTTARPHSSSTTCRRSRPAGAFDEAAHTTIVVESLKDLAMTHEIAVVGLAASDKPAFEARRMRLHHLRGSAALAHECDVALVLNEKSTAVSKTHSRITTPCERRRSSGRSSMSVEKNRGGPADMDLEFTQGLRQLPIRPGRNLRLGATRRRDPRRGVGEAE